MLPRLPPLQSRPRRPHRVLPLMRPASAATATAASAASAAAAAMQPRCCMQPSRRERKKQPPLEAASPRGAASCCLVPAAWQNGAPPLRRCRVLNVARRRRRRHCCRSVCGDRQPCRAAGEGSGRRPRIMLPKFIFLKWYYLAIFIPTHIPFENRSPIDRFGTKLDTLMDINSYFWKFYTERFSVGCICCGNGIELYI